ncbi:uncharacterized protein LTR77_010302 [Saxophila tyrrhenica]|uniref:Uncharacterized protein n=1 Tax=Saxophila tyrrhenica TaxID=1690608 RepID=A0AAV9NVN5_9PEZI|nr:hypothetical protein LTR77_010302 [Saxophila tyrrhenica]
MANDDYAPFPGEYDHIIVHKDEYLELSCAECGGNSQPRPPYPFCKGYDALLQHHGMIHKAVFVAPNTSKPDDAKTTTDKTGRVAYRILTQAEVKLIEQGHGADVIKKVITETTKHQAEPYVPPGIIPYKHYTTIVRYNDILVQLRCPVCGANARKKKGASNTREHNLQFYNGVSGLKGHMSNVHNEQFPGLKIKDVVLVCGKAITEAELEHITKDRTGRAIVKTRGDGSGKESKPKQPRKAPLSKEEKTVRAPRWSVKSVEGPVFRSDNKQMGQMVSGGAAPFGLGGPAGMAGASSPSRSQGTALMGLQMGGLAGSERGIGRKGAGGGSQGAYADDGTSMRERGPPPLNPQQEAIMKLLQEGRAMKEKVLGGDSMEGLSKDGYVDDEDDGGDDDEWEDCEEGNGEGAAVEGEDDQGGEEDDKVRRRLRPASHS